MVPQVMAQHVMVPCSMTRAYCMPMGIQQNDGVTWASGYYQVYSPWIPPGSRLDPAWIIIKGYITLHSTLVLYKSYIVISLLIYYYSSIHKHPYLNTLRYCGQLYCLNLYTSSHII